MPKQGVKLHLCAKKWGKNAFWVNGVNPKSLVAPLPLGPPLHGNGKNRQISQPTGFFLLLVLPNKFGVCCTLRSWLHEISALITTLSPGLEKNYTLEPSSKSFPGMTSMSGCLENCQIYSQVPIQETRSLNVQKLGDKSVP